MKYNRLLERKKLIETIETSLNYPLSLIVAPMGYGKTTAVHNLLDEKKLNYLWLYFEVDESSAKYIWDTFARQLHTFSERSSDKIRGMGFPYTTPQRNQFITFVESYTQTSPLYVVIDDYQYNHSEEIDAFIGLLIRAKIKGLRFIILSRTTPALDVTELILKEFCYRLTEKDFTLTPSEVGKLYRLNKVYATSQVIEETYHISEGWISAVQLLIQRYKEEASLESVGQMEELIELTLIRRLKVDKYHLALLGILESFSEEELCFIIGEESAKTLIETLMAMGAFIRYNKKSKRYVIHNIFMGYLYKNEFLKLPDVLKDSYYKRLGEWYIDNHLVMEGIRCFQKSNEYELILKEFEKDTIRKVFDYYPSYVCDIIDSISSEIIFNYPIAYLCYLHFLISAMDPKRGMLLLSEFKELSKRNIPKHIYDALNIEGEIAYLFGLLLYNDIDKMFEYQRMAYTSIGGPSLTTRPDKMPCAGSNSILYMYYKEQGQFKRVAESIRDNFTYYEHLANRVGTGIKDIVMAEYYLETGDIDKAELLAKKGLITAELLPQFDAIICAKYLLSRCALAQGNIKKGLKIIDSVTSEGDYQMNALYLSIRSPYVYAIDGIHLKVRHTEDLTDQLKSRTLDDKMLFFQSRSIGYVHYGQLLLLEKKYLELEVLCEELGRLVEPFNYLLGFLHMYLLESIACYHLHGFEEAQLLFEKALSIGRKDGIITSIAEYGELLLPLLEASEVTETDTYFKTIYAQTKKYAELNCAYHKMIIDPVSLTGREHDVMTLLCTGKRNAEIAKVLYISESAVKKLLSSIYKKMNVKNRASAIACYEDKLNQ